MGGAASKATRKLPKRVETPKWAGARTPQPTDPPREQKASETKTEAIERDAQDPHFLANLSRLGPVRVDHHMKTVRTGESETNRLFKSRSQSESEALSTQPIHNRLHAATLSELLDKRKSAKTQAEVERLAERYGIDVAKLQSLSRFVNSPSVHGASAVRTLEKDGEESIMVTAVWVEPRIQKLEESKIQQIWRHK
ncbi:hypothetical protein Hypma_008771 [Hypsizygus marmoreus]|uniref:Uncharacterized protein n=1 Tax=Hypsizygus marmoreus TaxID=39966 RepID=A0A369JSN6_HYPMA|nr:hypothetical protein Hypma_008771 [Hypsizygus marmoreus]